MRRSQPLGAAEHALLGLIHLEPRHGYELAERFGEGGELGEVCPLQPSLLYAHLRRLEELRYVASRTEVVGSRPPRHVFHLTDLGESEFFRWLDQPVRRNREIRAEFLLKLYFSGHIPEHDTLRLVEVQLAVAREELASLRRELENHASGSFRRLLRDVRLVATRGTIDWLETHRQGLAHGESTDRATGDLQAPEPSEAR